MRAGKSGVEALTLIETPLLMRLGAAASIIGHMAILTLGLLFADALPFESMPTEAIAVDIVAPEEAKALPKPADPPKPELPKPVEPKQPDPIDLSALTAPAIPTTSPEPPGRQAPQQKSQTAAAPASRPSPPPAPPPPPAAAAPQAAKSQSADALQPTPSPQTPSQPQQPPPSPPAPEPDVTVKYGVMLGLPAANLPAGKEYDGVEAPAFETAKVDANDVAAFRRHLKTCSTLPASVAPTDKVRIVLRVLLSPDGRLVAEPALLEASASAKGPVLMQRAMDALQACQPYSMLPADKYKEWKVLDLSFTPQDFIAGG
jgi:outer membrane biosynthesis protein TonB